MINNVVLVGRLTKDIELKKTQSNSSFIRFTVACNRKYMKDGQLQENTDFISCVAWRQSAEFLAQYAKKGDLIGVTGRITTGSYDGQYGKVYTTDVTCDTVRILNQNRKDNTQTNTQQTNTGVDNTPSYPETEDFSNTPSLDISSDDLPFY